jgi:hypothetical protein
MEPSLAVLCAHAEAANCYLEVLARDDISHSAREVSIVGITPLSLSRL